MSVLEVYRDGFKVLIESENLEEWKGYGFSEENKADPKTALVNKAIELKIASPSIIKRMSLETLNEKIAEAEAEE